MLALGSGAVVCKKGRTVREYKNDLVYQRQTSEREHMIDLLLLGVPAVAGPAAYALKSTPTFAMSLLSLPVLLLGICRIMLQKRNNKRTKFTVVRKLKSKVDYHCKRSGLIAIHLKGIWKRLPVLLLFTGGLGYGAISAMRDGLIILSAIFMVFSLLTLLGVFILSFLAFLRFIWWSNYKSKGLRFDEFTFLTNSP